MQIWILTVIVHKYLIEHCETDLDLLIVLTDVLAIFCSTDRNSGNVDAILAIVDAGARSMVDSINEQKEANRQEVYGKVGAILAELTEKVHEEATDDGETATS